MTKKRWFIVVSCVIVAMACVIVAAVWGGYEKNEVKHSLAQEVDDVLSSFDEKASLAGAKMYSSNPYDYKESKYYKQLVRLGLDAVPILSEKLCKNEVTGLNQYLVGLAIQDITETDLAEATGDTWISGEELAVVWKKFIEGAPEKIEEVLSSKEPVDVKIEKLKCYGVFGVAAVKEVEAGGSDVVLIEDFGYEFSQGEKRALEQYADENDINLQQVEKCFGSVYEKIRSGGSWTSY